MAKIGIKSHPSSVGFAGVSFSTASGEPKTVTTFPTHRGQCVRGGVTSTAIGSPPPSIGAPTVSVSGDSAARMHASA
jgi:hypothetical protein